MYESGIAVYRRVFPPVRRVREAHTGRGLSRGHLPAVEDFFKFKGKAMVSATPIIPSDPRFEEQGFEMLCIVPTYDYCKELTVVVTNNTVHVLRKLLERYRKAGEKVASSSTRRMRR